MQIPLTRDDPRLAELVRLARNGEDTVWTEHGRPSVHIVPVDERAEVDELATLLHALRGSAKKRFGPDAARATDFLHNDHSLSE